MGSELQDMTPWMAFDTKCAGEDPMRMADVCLGRTVPCQPKQSSVDGPLCKAICQCLSCKVQKTEAGTVTLLDSV